MYILSYHLFVISLLFDDLFYLSWRKKKRSNQSCWHPSFFGRSIKINTHLIYYFRLAQWTRHHFAIGSRIWYKYYGMFLKIRAHHHRINEIFIGSPTILWNAFSLHLFGNKLDRHHTLSCGPHLPIFTSSFKWTHFFFSVC